MGSYTHTTTYSGDTARAVKWIGFAQCQMLAILKAQQRSGARPRNTHQIYRPEDGVEIWVSVHPNQIRISAQGGTVVMSIPDTSRALNMRSLFSTDKKFNIPPAGVSPPGEDNHLVGDRYWISKDGKEAVSWKAGNLYYRGIMTATQHTKILASAVKSPNVIWVMADPDGFGKQVVLQLLTIKVLGGVGVITRTNPSGVLKSEAGTVWWCEISDDLTYAIAYSTDRNLYTLSRQIDTSIHKLTIMGNMMMDAGVISSWSLSKLGHYSGSLSGTGSNYTSSKNDLTFLGDSGEALMFMAQPVLYDGKLYGYGIGRDGSDAFNDSWLVVNTTGTVYLSSSDASISEHQRTSIYAVEIDIKTGGVTKTLIGGGGANVSTGTYNRHADAKAQYGSANSATETSTFRYMHHLDGYYGLAIFSQYFYTTTSSITGVYTYGSVNGTQTITETSSDTGHLDLIMSNKGSVSLIDSTVTYSSGVSTSSTFSSGQSMNPGVPNPVASDGYTPSIYDVGQEKPNTSASLPGHLVVCVSDDFRDKDNAQVKIRKTLIFTLDKLTRTATLADTLDYDIREFPDHSLGRISMTKWPKV